MQAAASLRETPAVENTAVENTAWKYVGDGRAVPGLPARDLTAADLAEVLAREHITEADVEACRLYLRVSPKGEGVEIGPPLAEDDDS